MSLDLYVYIEETDETDEEDIWSELPDGTRLEEVYWANITHNLTAMADAAGLYSVLWRPKYEHTKITPEVIEQLEAGAALLVTDSTKFKKFDSPNGWGIYEHFVPFVVGVLEAVKEHPNGWMYRSV